MPRVLPFQGVRYDAARVPDITRVTAPPYDMIPPEEQDELYRRDPHNVVRLILGREQENGRPVDTMCDEVYAQLGGRQPVPLTFQQYIGAHLHAREVDIIQMESPPARDARLGGQRPYR